MDERFRIATRILSATYVFERWIDIVNEYMSQSAVGICRIIRNFGIIVGINLLPEVEVQRDVEGKLDKVAPLILLVTSLQNLMSSSRLLNYNMTICSASVKPWRSLEPRLFEMSLPCFSNNQAGRRVLVYF